MLYKQNLFTNCFKVIIKFKYKLTTGDDSGMKKVDTSKSKESIKQDKKEIKELRRERSRKRSSPAFRAFVTTLKVMVALLFVAIAGVSIWFYNQIDFSFGDDLNTFDLKLSSTIYVAGEDGEYYEYEQYKSTDNRVWVDFENVPQNLKDAFVAIEDERFYTHNGMDLKRTLGAVFNVFVKGDSSYGGSTITQQLVKNLTKDNERTSARKMREITRSMVLESKFSKDEILELYMNSIYLSQGVHGIQAASYVYFGKPVDELNLAECATIAGITQFPSTYDPIAHPDNNRNKRITVLQKMQELGYITESEYNEAANTNLVFDGRKDQHTDENGNTTKDVQSYFADHLFEQAKADLMEEYGYPEQYTENLLYNGGLQIYTTMDPKIQKLAEDYYMNASNFPSYGSDLLLQSAIIIEDSNTGYLRAIVGGRGQKEDARVLNRATQSKRQPGSTIKPISVYGPAIEEGVANLSTYISNAEIKIGGWRPKNSNGKFSGPVPIQTAVAWSYNMPAIRTLQALTIDTSFEYLSEKMHMTSLVEEEERNGINYTDKSLPSLALGGLTDGVTLLEMSAAYSCIANGGMYIEPTAYIKICDKDGNVIIDKEQPDSNRVFSEESAFLTRELLKGVVRGGTAGGNTIPGMDTCGKTGTTDANKDKWFIGFTPYYCATVWTGFDTPRVIGGSNHAIKIWRDIMTAIHEDLPDKTFDMPDGIIKAKVCGYTGKYASGSCGGYHYADKNRLDGYCKMKHTATALSGGKYTPSTNDKKDDKNKQEETKTEIAPIAPPSKGENSAVPVAPPSGGSTESPGVPSVPTAPGGSSSVPSAPSPDTTPSTVPDAPVAPSPAPAPDPVPSPAPAPAPAPVPSAPNVSVPDAPAA